MTSRPKVTARSNSGRVCRDRHAQAGADQVFLEAGREGRMRQQGGDIGHHVGRGDGFSIGGGEVGEECSLDVWDGCSGVAPERKDATTKEPR